MFIYSDKLNEKLKNLSLSQIDYLYNNFYTKIDEENKWSGVVISFTISSHSIDDIFNFINQDYAIDLELYNGSEHKSVYCIVKFSGLNKIEGEVIGMNANSEEELLNLFNEKVLLLI
jgi:hypothetical protein